MATLGTLTLPNTFRHSPYIPQKRYSVAQTASGAVYQEANGIIHGDTLLEWTAELVCFQEYCEILQVYYSQGPHEFLGNWNENLVVDFINYSASGIGGGYLNLSGTFLVRCVNDTACSGTYY